MQRNGEKDRAFLVHWFANRKIKQFKGSGKLQYAYPLGSHHGTIVPIQKIAQVLDLVDIQFAESSESKICVVINFQSMNSEDSIT
jgi:hypothetical protein